MLPQISIVMPSLNQVVYLEEAVRSVLDQQGVSVELLVMDPGSTDGSRELLLQLKDGYGEKLKLCFEPDSGQSNAINKGVSLASGNMLGWLNSDDRLQPGILRRVVAHLQTDRPAWLYGQAGMIDEAGRPVSGFIVCYKNWRGRRFSRLKLVTEDFIPQMAVFWTRPLWDLAGGLDEQRHLDMDYDLWFRFARIVEPVILAEPLADFRVHGQAKGSQQTDAQLSAAYRTACQYAAELGWQGQVALLVHRLFSLRTRLIYNLIKP